MEYDRGGAFPHNLVTLSLFDPRGFRGAGHRFAPVQEVRLEARDATAGFLPGPLPAGEWTVEVDAHAVVAPSGCAVTVSLTEPGSGAPVWPAAAPPPRAPEPAPPAPGVPLAPGSLTECNQPSAPRDPLRRPRHRSRTGSAPTPARWLRGELHLHSTHSDGRWTTAEMAAAARGRGLDFMFLTDHNTVSGIESLREAVRGEVAVHPGQELTTFGGHALALGPEQWIDWRAGLDGRSIDDVARDVRRLDGVFVVAHPDAPPDPLCTGCQWTHADFDPALAHAVEVWGGLWDGPEERNPGCLALFRRWLDAGHRVTATGATDAHRHEDWQGAVPLTYVLAEDASLASVLGALRAGETYVSSGPALSLEASSPAGAVGIGGTAAGARAVTASCAHSPPAELRLVCGQQTRARAAVEGQGAVTAAVRNGDRWFCAELWRDDILLAITSPVYLEP